MLSLTFKMQSPSCLPTYFYIDIDNHIIQEYKTKFQSEVSFCLLFKRDVNNHADVHRNWHLILSKWPVHNQDEKYLVFYSVEVCVHRKGIG